MHFTEDEITAHQFNWYPLVLHKYRTFPSQISYSNIYITIITFHCFLKLLQRKHISVLFLYLLTRVFQSLSIYQNFIYGKKSRWAYNLWGECPMELFCGILRNFYVVIWHEKLRLLLLSFWWRKSIKQKPHPLGCDWHANSNRKLLFIMLIIL